MINTAVLGDFLPGTLKLQPDDLAPLRVVVADTSEQRFLADIRQQPVDVLVLELPIVGADTEDKVRAFADAAGAQRVVFVYGFGRRADVDRLRQQGVVVLRAPVTADEVKAAAVRAFDDASVARPRPVAAPIGDADLEWDAGVAAPRRFSQDELAALANVSSTIECECPQHLARLVGDLSAFEVYSANCMNRDDDDAALHEYLHRTTAKARALIEQALDKVARAEGLL